MSSLYKYTFIALVLVFTVSISGSRAQELFGTGFGDNFSGSETLVRKIVDANLYSINPNTGAATFIGNIGFLDCTGLDFHPITNELFAVCFEDIFLDAILVKVNRKTGAGTFVGPLNTDDNTVRDISFRSDGVLFAYIASKPSDILGIIDTETGNFTQVGNTGLNFSVGGLGFSLADVLFYAGVVVLDQDLFVLNQANGSPTFDTELIFNPPGRIFIESLDANPINDVMFTSYRRGGPNTILATIDRDTGQVQNIGPSGEVIIRGIAFLNPNPTRPIPTLSQYGLILAAVVLLAAALLFLRRRKSASEA